MRASHHPWQRGSNENTVAQSGNTYKGADLSAHSQKQLDAIAYMLNTSLGSVLNTAVQLVTIDVMAQKYNTITSAQ